MSWKQVRPILDCLCQIFSLHGFTPINANELYRAKFDRNEVTVPLWKLIYELLHFQLDRSAQIESQKVFAQTAPSRLVGLIKEQLNEQGYTYDHIRSLDEQMQRGSRSLLVCFAWLMHHLKFIDRCLEDALKSIFPDRSKDSLKLLLDQAMEMNVELREQLYAHPQGMTESFIDLENQYYRLDLFQFWFEHETIFWKWMESVLDHDPPRAVVQVNVQQLEAEREKFHAALDTLDDALVRLEQLWIFNEDRRAIQDDITSIISSIDGQISSLFSQLNSSPMK